MPSLQDSLFLESIVMGHWDTGASLRWEWRSTYWPVVLGDDGAHILLELRSKWKWEVFLWNGRWRGCGVTVMALLFPAAYFNFDMSVWVPKVSRRAKWFFCTQTQNVFPSCLRTQIQSTPWIKYFVQYRYGWYSMQNEQRQTAAVLWLRNRLCAGSMYL